MLGVAAPSPIDDGAGTDRDILLEVNDLRTYFETPVGSVRAVDGVSFTLERGRTIGIVGESGSGKTVLSRSIMNLLPRQSVSVDGTVRFNGVDVRSLTSAQIERVWGNDMAIILQDPMTSLTPVVRVGRQIMEPIRLHLGLSKTAAADKAIALLKSVGIPAPEKRMREYPHRLSGGMRQRVSIAIALSCEPTLLIADEPTTALDVTVQQQILNVLKAAQQDRNMGMLLITHDLGVVSNYTDEIIVMYAGQVVETAPTRTLFESMQHPYTQALLASIPRLGDPSHTPLQAIAGRPPSLTHPPPGCRFAARCRYAQQRCLTELPDMRAGSDRRHQFRCFYPVGTAEGERALADNLERGVTAAGTPVQLGRVVRESIEGTVDGR